MATHSQERVAPAAAPAISDPLAGPRRRYEAAHQVVFLVAEPDPALAQVVASTCDNGFLTVRRCSTAQELLFLAGRLQPGILLTRAALPDASAAAAIETIREFDDLPIIVALGPDETAHAGPAMAAGATSLTDHPYRPDMLRELVAHHAADVQARMLHEARVEVGELLLDGPGYAAFVRGEELPLTPRAFELLQLLVDRAGRVVTYEDIRDSIWTPRGERVTRQTVTVHIHRLREHLQGVAEINTIRRVGYRFTA